MAGEATLINADVVTALIAAAGAVILAAASYLFAKRQEREAALRQQKLEHYKEFTHSVNGVMLTQITEEGARAFAKASNALNLIAPQAVLFALQALQREIKSTNSAATKKTHDEALSRLFYEIRRDLGVSPKDDEKTFHVELVAPPPKKAVSGATE